MHEFAKWQDKFGADEAKKRLEQGVSSPNKWPAPAKSAGKERSSCGRLGQ